MPQITQLTAQKNPKFVNIFLDHKFAFSLSLDEVYQQKLKTGLELPQQKIDELTKLSSYQKLLDRAIKYISLRPRSQKEVTNWLKLKAKLSPESLAFKRLIDRLTQLDLINDHKFAQWWIDQRATYKPRGPKLLYQELIKKGIPRGLIETELSKLTDQTANLRQLAAKKWRQLNKSTKQMNNKTNEQFNNKTMKQYKTNYKNKLKLRAKLISFLQRKGFSFSQIRPVIDELLNKK